MAILTISWLLHEKLPNGGSYDIFPVPTDEALLSPLLDTQAAAPAVPGGHYCAGRPDSGAVHDLPEAHYSPLRGCCLPAAWARQRAYPAEHCCTDRHLC